VMMVMMMCVWGGGGGGVREDAMCVFERQWRGGASMRGTKTGLKSHRQELRFGIM